MNNQYEQVEIYGEHLKGKKIAIIVRDSCEAYKMPAFILELRRYSCEIFPYMKKTEFKYVTPLTLEWASGNKVEYDTVDSQLYDAVLDGRAIDD